MLKKIWNQVRYKLTLFVSFLLLFMTDLLDSIVEPNETSSAFLILYTIAILLAALWAMLNYLDHLRINPVFKEYLSIEEFVEELQVPQEEQVEIKAMMMDYVADKTLAGQTKEAATAEIINQFKQEELAQKPHFFFFHSHKYLLQLGVVMLLIGAPVYLIENYLDLINFPVLQVLSYVVFSYGLGFILTYVLYKLLNKILQGKEDV